MGYNKYNRDPDIENLLDGLEPKKSKTFRYMRDQFDILTNEGEDEIPDVHVDEVARRASNEFNISADEAIELYHDISFKINEMYQDRL